MENMFILDYLIVNEDYYLNNFGIIRNVKTLKRLECVPIFDNRENLNIEYYDEEELYISGEGRFFYEVKSFNEIIKVVKALKRINITALDDLPECFDELLYNYQHLIKFSNTRINRLCIILNRQIN